MSNNLNENKPSYNGLRYFIALLIGLIGAVAIWVATPYNNFLVHNTYISDSYISASAIFCLLVIVLIINPILFKFCPRFALNFKQLALIFGIMLVAVVPSSSGFLRQVPYPVAQTAREVSNNKTWADAYAVAKVPQALFPDEIGYKKDVPNSKNFLLNLPPGEKIPWKAWLKPLFSWGTFAMTWWIMMIGMAGMAFPQWRNNERLPFPLLTVQRALIEEPDKGKFFPPLLRTRSFWIAAISVFVLYLFYGGNIYFPQKVPSVALRWNISYLFTEEPLRYLPEYVRISRVCFIFLGVAFFMSNRVSFSFFFFQVAYALYIMLASAYAPPFQVGTIDDQRGGAMIALTIGILWLGRSHWMHVFKCMFIKVKTDEDKRDRQAGWFFLLGAVGFFAWLIWCGVQIIWAIFIVSCGMMSAILLMRFMAETGIALIGLQEEQFYGYLRMFSVKSVSAISTYMVGLVGNFFGSANRVCLGVMSMHAIGLDEKAEPKDHVRLYYIIAFVLLLSLVVCGAVHLQMNYKYKITLDGEEQPLGGAWGIFQLDKATNLLCEQQRGQFNVPVHNRLLHTGFGITLAGVLQWLCLLTPNWPIHPVGLLIMNTWFGTQIWISIFFGWMLKLMIVKFGGSRLYTSAKPFFLGLIMGEVFASVFWGLVPALLVFLDKPYKVVLILPY